MLDRPLTGQALAYTHREPPAQPRRPRRPPRCVIKYVASAALALGIVLVAGCGSGLSGSSSATGACAGLAGQDLTGKCRSIPTTMGALEASDGSGATAALVASASVSQSASRALQVSWQPLSDASGYVVYFGKTPDSAHVLVSDLPANSGLVNPSAPEITYDAARDLGLYVGDTACFQIYGYDSARTLLDPPTLVCTTV